MYTQKTISQIVSVQDCVLLCTSSINETILGNEFVAVTGLNGLLRSRSTHSTAVQRQEAA